HPEGRAPGGEFLAVGGRQRKRRRDHWDARIALRKGFVFESWSGSDRLAARDRGGAARSPYESRTHPGCVGNDGDAHSTNSHDDRLRRSRCFGLRRDAAWPRQSCHRGARFLKTGRSADLLSQAIGSRTSALCCLSADRRERETRSKSGRGGVRTLARTFASIFLRITSWKDLRTGKVGNHGAISPR